MQGNSTPRTWKAMVQRLWHSPGAENIGYLINHQATMAYLISLLLILFEKTRERNKIGK